MANILVIEDEPILAKNITDFFVLNDHDATCVKEGEAGVESAQAGWPDVILCDYQLPGISGLDVLRQLRAVNNPAAFIVLTAHGSVDTAVEAMKLGASDFISKPVDLQALLLVVERALKYRSAAVGLDYFRDRERPKSASASILGQCEQMRAVKTFVERMTAIAAIATPKPPSILITGETGTGKDLVARAIHYNGPRSNNQFVHVNCAAIPDQLAESELFGHVKGAFTDARTDKRGLFEVANEGTIFLNEIGHVSLALQAKLLDVLERRIIRPVGATREKQVNVHVIAATNRDLSEAITASEFREDLYHRLHVLKIDMPPLRERDSDIEELADFFLKEFVAQYGCHVTGFGDDAKQAFKDYDWPGNVRELRHAIESAVLNADGPIITEQHLNIKMPEPSGTISLELASTSKTIVVDFTKECPKLEDIEYEIIKSALDYSKHNLSRAARLLGISRDAVRYRIEKFEKNT